MFSFDSIYILQAKVNIDFIEHNCIIFVKSIYMFNYNTIFYEIMEQKSRKIIFR